MEPPAKPIQISLLALILTPLALVACGTTSSDVRSSDNPSLPAQDMGAMQLPPGWTEEDMKACMTAGMPGKMHERLAQSVGTWTGTSTMWMAPETTGMTSPAKATITVEMDGRFTKCEHTGEIPGMGTFRGVGYYGFDNVAQQFVSAWIDNHGSGIMNGTGAMSADGKSITWTYKYMCPIAKEMCEMREIETWTGKDSTKLEMYGTDPKTGVEFKMMQIELKRESGTAPRG